MGRCGRGWRAVLLLASVLSLVLGALASCAFEPGGDAVAFVRGNQLWMMQPDGSNAHRVASGAIVGFSWSPDHHEIVFRTSLQGGASPPMDPRVAGPDAPGDLYITTINGNSPLQISPSFGALARSDAWWNPNGNRVLYRQFYPGPNAAPTDVMYIESQIDQPLGIASKTLLNTAVIPALSEDGSRVAVVDSSGNLRVGAPATHGAIVARGALLQFASGRRARVLWQPGHDALLYAMRASSQGTQGDTLVLRDLASGSVQTLLTAPDLLDATFSPDGGELLARTAQQFSVYRVADTSAPLYSWPDDDLAAVAYWAPDSRLVLMQDLHGMQLANPGARTVTPLLVYASALGQVGAPASGLWHPAAGSPWSADSTGIVFAATGADAWHRARLAGSGTGGATAGLYIGAISSDGTPGSATCIDVEDDRAPTWSYANPAATFLLPS